MLKKIQDGWTIQRFMTYSTISNNNYIKYSNVVVFSGFCLIPNSLEIFSQSIGYYFVENWTSSDTLYPSEVNIRRIPLTHFDK